MKHLITIFIILIIFIISCGQDKSKTEKLKGFGIISKSTNTLTIFRVDDGKVTAQTPRGRVTPAGMDCQLGSGTNCPSGGMEACEKSARPGETCTFSGSCICGSETGQTSGVGKIYYVCVCGPSGTVPSDISDFFIVE